MTPRSEFLQALLANPAYTSFAAWSFLLSAAVFVTALVLVSRRRVAFEAAAALPLADDTAQAKFERRP